MEEKKLLTTADVADMLGVTADCVRKWDESGVLKHDFVTEGGHRRYTEETVEKYRRKNPDNDNKRVIMEEWQRKISETITSRECGKSDDYVIDNNSRKCYPVVRDSGEKSRIKLTSEGFVSEVVAISDGVEFTKSVTDYVMEREDGGVSGNNSTLYEGFEKDINNIWGYINWYLVRVYDSVSGFYGDKITVDEFSDILYNGDFSWVCEESYYGVHRYSNSKCYGEFIGLFAEQVLLYKKMNDKLSKEKYYTDSRELFVTGNYNDIQVDFMGGVLEFRRRGANDHSYIVCVHVFDKDKYEMLKEKHKGWLTRCCDKLYPLSPHIYADDLITEEWMGKEYKADDNEEGNGEKQTDDKVWKESELTIIETDVIRDDVRKAGIIMREAVCPECGNKMASATTRMYNPFDGGSIASCKCVGCGKVFRTEYAYPRGVFVKGDFNETEHNIKEIQMWLK